jgi:hypothetical protein
MNSSLSLFYEESVFLMEIKIFRRYMSILSVYRPGINITVNELFVMYDVTFVLKNASST